MTSISVILATYNRAKLLEQTLGYFAMLDLEGLEVEFVVVDNCCTDNTREVVNTFAGKLPVVYMYEQKSGKSKALNKVLREHKLKEIVVFTDDDIKPQPDWLQVIAKSCIENPEISVFGGRITLHWLCDQPDWLKKLEEKDSNFFSWCYGLHDLGEEPLIYNSSMRLFLPFGANFWLKKSVLDQTMLFEENSGPTNSGQTSVMGEDTLFLTELQDRGYKIMYIPTATVGHFVSKSNTEQEFFVKRAKTSGRQRAQTEPFKLPGLYAKCFWLWYFIRIVLYILQTVKLFALWCFSLNTVSRNLARIRLHKRMAYDRYYLHNNKEIWKAYQK